MRATPTISAYSELTEVGRGGFGTVYRATETRFGRTVAVKVIRDAGVGRDVVARFERECLALGSLSGHPNIVAVYDQGESEDGDLFLVMEFLGGGSFAQRLASRGLVRPADAAVWGGALAGALETAHRSGIVHRDVKPENILFSEYGVPKLVDFGIARMRSAYETRTGFMSATLNHAAPEIVAGGSVSPSADVYSLASVLFTMLAGTAPFDRPGEESLAPLIARIATAPPPDLGSLGVPPELAAVVKRALAKEPTKRFESAAAFGFALRDCARASGLPDVDVSLGNAEDVAEAKAAIAVAPPTPDDSGLTVDVPRERVVVPQREEPTEAPRRRRWPIAVAVLTVLVLIGGGVAALATRGDDTPDVTGPSKVSTTGAVDLPTGTISAGNGCDGFACTFKVTSPTPLPDGATWVWSIDGVQQPTTADTLAHTFKKAEEGTVNVVSSNGQTSGIAATFAVQLGSWEPTLDLISPGSTATMGTVSLSAAFPGHPECLPSVARLQIESAADEFTNERELHVPKAGKLDVDVDRGATYRIALASKDVMNGICEQKNSNEVAIGYLSTPSTPTSGPTTPSASATHNAPVHPTLGPSPHRTTAQPAHQH